MKFFAVTLAVLPVLFAQRANAAAAAAAAGGDIQNSTSAYTIVLAGPEY